MSTVQTLKLSDLSNDAFESLVNEDVRGTLDSGTSDLLREPDNVERWHDTLITLKRRVEIQLTGKKAELAAAQAEYVSLGPSGKTMWLRKRAEHEKWRQTAIRFKNGVEDKIAEAKRLRSKVRGVVYSDYVVTERDQAIREALKLRSAIAKHKLETETASEDVDQDDIDIKLWSLAESA